MRMRQTRKDWMSRHKIETVNHIWVFGWDPPLRTFFLQRFSPGEDEVADFWLGGEPNTYMREVEDLVREAHRCGLHIDYTHQVLLYGDQHDGR